MGGRSGKALLAVFAMIATIGMVTGNAAAAPANDMVADAQVIGPTVPLSVSGTTVGATAEVGEMMGVNTPTASVWYRWTAPTTGKVQVDLCSGLTPQPDYWPLNGISIYGPGSSWAEVKDKWITGWAGPCKLDLDAEAASTYMIQINFFDPLQFGFTLRIHPLQRPANDNFAAAQNIGSGLPRSVAGSTVNATGEADDPEALKGFGADNPTVWYRWTAARSEQIEIDICDFDVLPGSSTNRRFGIYTGSSLEGLDPVAETDSGALQCTLLANVTQGTEYRIGLGMTYGGEGTFTLAIRSAAPPDNDAFANATTVGPEPPILVDGDNSHATADPDEPMIGGNAGSAHSVWYRWTSPVTDKFRVSACNLHGNQLSVFSGSALADLTEVGDLPDYAPYCSVSLDAEQGKTYVIGVTASTDVGNGGAFQLDIHQFSPPANDYFANAQEVGPALPVKVNGDNTDAGTEPGEPGFFGSSSEGPYSTVWYRWKSTVTETVEVSACGSSVLPEVYTGNSIVELDLLAPVSDTDPVGCGETTPGLKVDLSAKAGVTYRIRVDAQSQGSGGPFTFGIVSPNAPPPDDGGGQVANLDRQLKRAIRKCRTRFRLRGSKTHRKKIRVKRATCIRKAKLKFAVKRCHRITTRSTRKKCIRKARLRYRARSPRSGH